MSNNYASLNTYNYLSIYTYLKLIIYVHNYTYWAHFLGYPLKFCLFKCYLFCWGIIFVSKYIESFIKLQTSSINLFSLTQTAQIPFFLAVGCGTSSTTRLPYRLFRYQSLFLLGPCPSFLNHYIVSFEEKDITSTCQKADL